MWIWLSGHLELSLARLWNGTPANSHSSENIFPEKQDDLPHHAQVPGSNILRLHQAPIHQRSRLVQNYHGALRRLPIWLPATKPGSVQVINFYPWRSGLCKEAWSSMLNSMFTRDHRGNSHQAGDKWLKDCNSCSCQQVRFFCRWG